MLSGVIGIFMIGFGVLWTCMAIAITAYNFKNATGKNRYSAFDITDAREEPDPLNKRFGNQASQPNDSDDKKASDSKFCPYCGKNSRKTKAECFT